MRITLKNILGKTVLIGLTFVDQQGNISRQTQLYGQITAADKEEGILVSVAGSDEPFTLPPDPTAFRAASKGEYRLRSTGEVVVDPDLLCTYTIQENHKTRGF